MNRKRTITHPDGHTDVETYLQDADGVWTWAVTQCKQEKQAMTKATYEFDYAMKRLKDAIDYAQETGIFVEARLWSLHVEAAYNADIEAEQKLTANANEGAKLMHSLATGGEQSVLSRLDNGVDAVDAQRWQDAPDPLARARAIALPNGQLRSYTSYNNTGKAQPLTAEDVDGERLGE